MDSELTRKGQEPPSLLLARRADFRLGAALVRPSMRTVEGPGASLAVEPRVMQVLMAFVDAQGAVLTRDDLMQSCWKGAVVGDDAINRTIAEIRRVARATQSGFGIETIPRVGYRLTGAVAEQTEPPLQNPPDPVSVDRQPTLPISGEALHRSRRGLIGGALALAGLAAIGFWVLRKPGPDPRVDELMGQGRQLLRLEMPGSARGAAEAFRAALAIEPRNASAWGLLSVALRQASDVAGRDEAGAFIAESEAAARQALDLDENEPNAMVTLALLQRGNDDWMTTEKRLREVLAIDARNTPALDYLVAQLQAAGYVQESWELNERAIAFDPLRPAPQFRKALKLWIRGEADEADRVAANATELWPDNQLVQNSRLVVQAFSNRLPAAHLAVEEQADRLGMLSPPGVAMWHASLAALETRSLEDINAAREAILAAAPLGPGLSAQAVMLLSELGEVDAAYAVVEGFLLRRGLMVTRDRVKGGSEHEIDVGWRGTQWLFTPATKALREDPRFELLAESIGLSQYWRQRGIPPDERRAPD